MSNSTDKEQPCPHGGEDENVSRDCLCTHACVNVLLSPTLINNATHDHNLEGLLVYLQDQEQQVVRTLLDLQHHTPQANPSGRLDSHRALRNKLLYITITWMEVRVDAPIYKQFEVVSAARCSCACIS